MSFLARLLQVLFLSFICFSQFLGNVLSRTKGGNNCQFPCLLDAQIGVAGDPSAGVEMRNCGIRSRTLMWECHMWCQKCLVLKFVKYFQYSIAFPSLLFYFILWDDNMSKMHSDMDCTTYY